MSGTEIIPGVDGNDMAISLYIHEPADRSGLLPAWSTPSTAAWSSTTCGRTRTTSVWRGESAATGMVVVGVEFRNGGGKLGNHPFPAGLNDCASGVEWTAANKERLGISHLIVSGESGGGNLALATALKARQDGWSSDIAGVYAQCPYISNGYANPPAALTSLTENDGYFLIIR